jgi:hypothetical protein
MGRTRVIQVAKLRIIGRKTREFSNKIKHPSVCNEVETKNGQRLARKCQTIAFV